MGVVNCSIHGMQGIHSMCVHIWEGMQENNILESHYIPLAYTDVCPSCYDKYGIQAFDNITVDSLFELPEKKQDEIYGRFSKKYDKINKKYACAECFKAVQIIDAKKKHKPAPFEAFENTLMYEDNEVIEQLKELLKSSFQFEKLNYSFVKNHDAFFVWSGAVSYPLYIRFYYIIKKEEQDFLLNLIDDFFKKFPKKQRKVQFYEKEVWIHEQQSTRKGEEKLLREQIIK